MAITEWREFRPLPSPLSWNWCRDFFDRAVIYLADDTHPVASPEYRSRLHFFSPSVLGHQQRLQNSSARGRRNFERARRSLYLAAR